MLGDSLLLRVSPSSPSCVSPRLGLSLRAGWGPHRLPAAPVRQLGDLRLQSQRDGLEV